MKNGMGSMRRTPGSMKMNVIVCLCEITMILFRCTLAEFDRVWNVCQFSWTECDCSVVWTATGWLHKLMVPSVIYCKSIFIVLLVTILQEGIFSVVIMRSVVHIDDLIKKKRQMVRKMIIARTCLSNDSKVSWLHVISSWSYFILPYSTQSFNC